MANVKLYGNGVEGGAEDRYFCYGGVRTPDLVEWARDDAKSFREDLNLAYQKLSNQILTEMVGLAPESGVEYFWEHAEKACTAKPNEKVSGNRNHAP